MTASQVALRGCFKEAREDPGYIGVFLLKKTGKTRNKKKPEHQKITANHKNQTSQVRGFSAFLCIGKCKNLGLLKSSL